MAGPGNGADPAPACKISKCPSEGSHGGEKPTPKPLTFLHPPGSPFSHALQPCPSNALEKAPEPC